MRGTPTINRSSASFEKPPSGGGSQRGPVVDGDVLRLRIEALLEYLARVDRFKEVERERFVAEPDTHHLAERYLQLAAEAALDIAHHIIADRGYAAPATYREAF